MSPRKHAALALLALAPLLQDAAPPDPAEQLASMGWLAGEWSGEMWGGRYVAYYSTPEGGKILSHSRLLKGAEVAFHEFEVFEAREGGVHLAPYPGGRPADGFALAELDPEARRAVFENPDKDFPTRIVYERPAEGELRVTLSDPHGGSDKREVFELSR